MASNFPWAAYIRERGRQNERAQDSNTLGTALQGIEGIASGLQQYKQKQIMDQLIQAMKTQGAPQQGPQLPGVGMGMGPAPMSGMGGPAADNSQLIRSLMMRLDPQGMMAAMLKQQMPMNPLQQSEITKNLALAKRAGNPPTEWSDTGRTTKEGFPIFVNKSTAEEKVGTIAGQKGKSDADEWKHTLEQDKLEKEYGDRVQRVVGARSGGLGLQDQKVDQAIHLRSMVNQAWNPNTRTYELPEMQQGELVMGLANLVSGSQVSNIEQLRAITPRTARGDMAHLVSYWTGQPLTKEPQAMIKNLVTSIDRQGKVSEQLRDKYVSGLKLLVPQGLDKNRASSIANAQLTSSFSDLLKQSPDQQGETLAWSDQNEQRLQELLRKKQSGTLGK